MPDFDDMRAYECAAIEPSLPGVYRVVRLDGRGFTRLTKELHDFEKPFDLRFHELMVATTEHVMNAGFRVVMGYTQSDEISLLLHRDDDTYGRVHRKVLSVLAGEASARFSLGLGAIGVFDARVAQLPDWSAVERYFTWRMADAVRNALSAHCYWSLRRAGQGAREASDHLSGMPRAQKHELLFRNGVNFNDLPLWQRRGAAIYTETYEKVGHNPTTGESTTAVRHRLAVDRELPRESELGPWLAAFRATAS